MKLEKVLAGTFDEARVSIAPRAAGAIPLFLVDVPLELLGLNDKTIGRCSESASIGSRHQAMARFQFVLERIGSSWDYFFYETI